MQTVASALILDRNPATATSAGKFAAQRSLAHRLRTRSVFDGTKLRQGDVGLAGRLVGRDSVEPFRVPLGKFFTYMDHCGMIDAIAMVIMKRLAQMILCLFLLVSFSSSVSAVLRPRFPRRAGLPHSGDWFVIGENDKKPAPPNK